MHIFLFAPVRYEFLHQRPQKLADQFLANGIGVTYVQPSGFKRSFAGNVSGIVRALSISFWYHLLGVVSFLIPAWPGTNRKSNGTTNRTGLKIISLPVTYPINRVDSPTLERFTAAVYRQFLLRRIADAKITDSVAIVQTPFWGNVLRRGDFSMVCYDCLDDVSLAAGNASEGRFADYEQRLIDVSSCITTTAAMLEARLRTCTDKPILRIPNGVDYEWFQERARETPMPVEIAKLSRPIVGYIGHIAAWIDYELIATVAKALPEIAFVFVGPLELPSRLSELHTSSNIFWLGERQYAEIPSYVKSFDVCVIPFKHGDIARTTNPVKLYEYFALGKPVVSTVLDELHLFAHENLVLLADSPERFISAIREALNDHDQSRQNSRMRIAAEHSWSAHARRFIDAIKLS